MVHALLTFINDNVPGITEKKTLVAVSGGVDSMVMAELFRRADFSFAIAHCNFGLRGAESDGDEAAVRHWADKQGVTFHTRKFETAHVAEEQGISIQMAARDLRYAWFEELIEAFRYDYLATAHHADDNIETVLLNLVRGTGLPGLLGIAPVKGHTIRPLLFVPKNDILEFAQKEKLTWREDSSNTSDAYRRNLLRHKVLPVLQEMNPSLHKTFEQNLERLRAVSSVVDRQLSKWSNRAVRSGEGKVYISIPMILMAEEPTSVLHGVLEKYHFNYAQTKQIVASLKGISGKEFFSATHSLLKDREELIVEPIREAEAFDPIPLREDTDKVALRENSFLVARRMPRSPELKLSANAQTAYFDATCLQFPLKVRSWRPGDRFQPFGMGGKSKKVSDLLVDAKVPVNQKKECLVLTDNAQNILWVLGLRTDDRFGVKPDTTDILQYRIVTF
ncbi:tRNA lysidine(34) synthetase TilS [Persicitalea jodogahamensis]|uniref:tRNA(Ile)-lysidine synthase n=1 Tax=Persicitalea jodogahamensis TaxID=402147 RepID=A0A8J3D2T9_9BACT|nr:tRNA lysidine(34) synthetase TilS [Persicitalea jodogahamensis]GHB61299.1 tRNA(Ile)-lysidine synthase [Persicitalea jodogahamensis]